MDSGAGHYFDFLFRRQYSDINRHCSLTVPVKRSRILEVVVVRRIVIINLGTGNLESGGKGRVEEGEVSLRVT